ncbi:MAG: hypothetical protein AAGG51_18345 [Cyanobacteria bacterium P01_G01_bin.54]
MTKSLTRIEQEIQDNLVQFEQLQTQLNQSYQTYMTVLGTALRRQLVLAAYQLCTRAYATAFLDLSEPDRARLQQRLQQLGYQAAADLQATLTRPYASTPSTSKQKLRSELLKRLPITPEQLQMIKDKLLQKHDRSDEGDDKTPPDASEEEGPIVIALDSEQLQSMFSSAAESEAEPEHDPDQEKKTPDADNDTPGAVMDDEPSLRPSLPEMMADLAAIAGGNVPSAITEPAEAQVSEPEEAIEPEFSETADVESLPPSEPFEPPKNPIEFLRWGQAVETSIQAILKSVSLKTNRLLHRTEILSNQLPSKLFAAAIEADEGSGSSHTATAPNTMNLIVETDLSADSEEAETNVLPIVVVRLRLAEIEMAENSVAASRSQLREGLARMKTLAGKYQKLQKDQATAQAEAAWRGAWYEAVPATEETAATD